MRDTVRGVHYEDIYYLLGKRKRGRGVDIKKVEEEQASLLKQVLIIIDHISLQEHPEAPKFAYFGLSVISGAISKDILAVRTSDRHSLLTLLL